MTKQIANQQQTTQPCTNKKCVFITLLLFYKNLLKYTYLHIIFFVYTHTITKRNNKVFLIFDTIKMNFYFLHS